MSKRTLSKEKSVEGYFFDMKKLASRGAIETEGLIQHVIDYANDKIVLYETIVTFNKIAGL